MQPFKGPYLYSEKIIKEWESTSIGVYYIGIKTSENQLKIFYIGKATGDGGVRERLLEHLSETKWSDATHFGFHFFTGTDTEKIEEFEKKEITKYKPKYNTMGV